MMHFKFQISSFRLGRRCGNARCLRQFEVCNLKSEIRPAFTLTELLIVMLILSIMAAMTLAVVAGATNMAREQRTRAIIAKLDQLLLERYEGYRTRAVPLALPVRQANMANPRLAATMRLSALRELMRLEMPDRISDLCGTSEIADLNNDNTLNVINLVNLDQGPALALTRMPSLGRSYKRQAMRNMASTGWTLENQGAECLYLIVTTMQDGDKNAIDYFLAEEIGDTDGDGMKEILDAWGTPITFLRWAPGYVSNPWDVTNASMLTNQIRPQLDANGNVIPFTPDPFDPVKVDPLWAQAVDSHPFELRPLIISAGADKELGIIHTDFQNDGTLVAGLYGQGSPNPYLTLPQSGRRIGEPIFGTKDYADNLTNHYQQTP